MNGSIARALGLALALGATFAAGVSPTVAQDRASLGLPDVIELPDELAAVLRGYETAWGARDADALAALFTEDGFVLRPGYPPSHGREAIREAYANSGGTLSLRAYEYAIEGSVGYIIGGYSGDPSRPESGKFVLAIRRGSDGWLIAADMDNGNR